MTCWRGPFGVTLRQCLREVTLPTFAAAFVAVIWHWLDDPLLADDIDTAAATSPWLTLPLLVAAFGCSLVAARTWPTFALRRVSARLSVQVCSAHSRLFSLATLRTVSGKG